MTEKKEVTISQLIYIKSLVEKNISKLVSDMISNSTISYPITQNTEVNEELKEKATDSIFGKSVEELKVLYNECINDLDNIDTILEEYNVNTKIEINGEQLSISSALRFNHRARDRFQSEINLYKGLLRNSKSSLSTNNGIILQTEPTFNVEEVELALENYKKLTNTISLKIEEKNSQTSVYFQNASKYLSE